MIAGTAAAIGFSTRMAKASSAAADPLPVPHGAVVLEVAGAIGQTNLDDVAIFDDDMLGALRQHSFVTRTAWTANAHEFSGPSLHDVLCRVDPRGTRLVAEAANAYRTSFPVAELSESIPIVARRIDGKPFGLRHRGPLWIMYPFDDVPQLRTETNFSRSVWQLVRLRVEQG